MKYYISDLHFFHDNIRKFCNRPFETVEEMNEQLIKNWNSVVEDNDEVYVLGDMFFKSNSPDAVRGILRKLKGKKYLIHGNHDKWCNDKELQTWFEWIKIYDEINDQDRRVILFHYPIEEWNGYYRDSYCLYGHVHNTEEHLAAINNRYNVSADVINFTPQTLDQLIALNENR